MYFKSSCDSGYHFEQSGLLIVTQIIHICGYVECYDTEMVGYFLSIPHISIALNGFFAIFRCLTISRFVIKPDIQLSAFFVAFRVTTTA